MQRLRRAFISVLSMLLVFCLIGAIPSQAASQEAKIEKQTWNLLEACRKYNMTKVLKYIDMKNPKNDFSYIKNNEWNKYIKKIKKHDLADITKVKIKGKNATVWISLDTVSCYDIISDCITEGLHERIDQNKLINNITKDLKYYSKHCEECQETYDLKIKFTKIKNKWVVSKVTRDVQFLYDSGATAVLEDFKKDPYSFY